MKTNRIRLAPLLALALPVIVPLWAPQTSDLGLAYGFYSSWAGMAALLLLVVACATTIHLSVCPRTAPKIESFLARQNAKIIYGYFIIYAALFSTLAIIAYLRFHSDVDYANFLQSFFSAARGQFFTNCLANEPLEISLFADHNSPIMFLILPIYMLLPFPSSLLIISTLVLAATAPILYRYLSRTLRLDHTTSLAISAAITLAPYYASQHFEGLSMEMFAPPLFVLCYGLFERQKFVPFMLTLLVLNAVKEQVAIVMMVFVLIALIKRRDKKWVIGPLLLNAAMLIISFGIVIPYFRPTGDYKLLSPDTAASLPEQAMLYLKSPGLAVSHVLEPFRLTYLYIVLASNLFFLPFISLEGLFIVPSLAKNLLFVGWAANVMSKHSLLMSGAMAVVVGKSLLRLTRPKVASVGSVERGRWARAIAILLLFSSIAHAPTWLRNIDLSKGPMHAAKVKLLDIIPSEVPIALPQDMLTRFSARNKLYNSATPFGITGFERDVDYVVIDEQFHPEHYDYEALLRDAADRNGLYMGFKLIWQCDSLHLFKRQ
ncbi:DUF2079 domain-containing protein [bacterium]|nr:DUF2079 domain-containing protein [bacterium]